MTKANMHIHSKYSWDSKMELNDVAKYLLKENIYYGGIADHVEFDKEALPYVLTKFKIRNLEIDEINKRYRERIKLLKGVEISEPHLYKDSVDALKELNLDFIMGSIHRINRNAKTDLEKKQVYYTYYSEMLKMIKANQIDILGHMDYIKRYYQGDFEDYSQLNEIFVLLKQNNIIMELNSSATRRNCNQVAFPDIDKMGMYKFRQKDITIGTDAHNLNELVDNLEETEYLARFYDLKPVVFEKRKIERI